MSEPLDTGILLESARQVLETMFFTSFMGDRDAPPDGPCVDACVSFRGSPSGVFGLRLSTDAARSIAANFLGAEDENELTEDQIGQVVCELANMICGAVLSRVESGCTFDIAPPELLPPPGAWTHCVDLDSGALALSLTLDEKP